LSAFLLEKYFASESLLGTFKMRIARYNSVLALVGSKATIFHFVYHRKIITIYPHTLHQETSLGNELCQIWSIETQQFKIATNAISL